MANSKREGYRGYCNPNEFGGNRIPIPIQNLIMRDYANRRNLMFKLSVNELNFPNCYVQLMNMLKQIPNLEGVLICSLFILPKERDMRTAIYESFLSHNAELHLVMENAIIRSPQDVEKMESIITISETLLTCPTSMPDDLLPHLSQADFS